MTVDGIWNLTIATPIGRQHATLELSQLGGALHGVAKGQGEDVTLRDILLEGNRLTWAQSITRPMRLNLTFDVTIDGDQMHGTSKAGRLPKSTVSGHRITHGIHEAPTPCLRADGWPLGGVVDPAR